MGWLVVELVGWSIDLSCSIFIFDMVHWVNCPSLYSYWFKWYIGLLTSWWQFTYQLDSFGEAAHAQMDGQWVVFQREKPPPHLFNSAEPRSSSDSSENEKPVWPVSLTFRHPHEPIIVCILHLGSTNSFQLKHRPVSRDLQHAPNVNTISTTEPHIQFCIHLISIFRSLNIKSTILIWKFYEPKWNK